MLLSPPLPLLLYILMPHYYVLLMRPLRSLVSQVPVDHGGPCCCGPAQLQLTESLSSFAIVVNYIIIIYSIRIAVSVININISINVAAVIVLVAVHLMHMRGHVVIHSRILSRPALVEKSNEISFCCAYINQA